MIKHYGIHPAHDAAIACNSLRRAIRELSDADESTPVGLGLAANMADVLADALDRYWWTVRPTLDEPDPEDFDASSIEADPMSFQRNESERRP